MSVNLKGKTYRNTQEQVLENARKIEELEARVKALEEGLPEPKELYMHNIQLRDAETIADADVVINFSLFTNNNTPFTTETLKDYLYDNGYRGATKFIPAVGVTDDDNFSGVSSVDFSEQTTTTITIESTIIGICADADDIRNIILSTDEDTVDNRVYSYATSCDYIDDSNPIKIY